jgi:hypothetical protein
MILEKKVGPSLAFSCSSRHVYAPLLLIICQESGNKLRGNAAHGHGVRELMDFSAAVFMNEFSNFFNILCRLAGAWPP